MADKKKTRDTSQITDEEVGEILNRLGRKAGRGDSPYSQDMYNKLYGLDGKKKQEGNQ